MASRGSVLIFETAEEVAHAAAERFVNTAASTIQRQDRFAMALSGGSTPRRAYEILATSNFSKKVDWPRVHLFFGDERMVPPGDDQSNYRMIHQAMISKLPIPLENVHRIRGEVPIDQSLKAYAEELHSFFPAASWPRFDLIWLGLGEDGHTASLFPNANTDHGEAWLAQTMQPETQQLRISLTFAAINHAARIDFLVTGSGKASIVKQVLNEGNGKKLPAQQIAPVDGVLEWLIDRAAASECDSL